MIIHSNYMHKLNDLIYSGTKEINDKIGIPPRNRKLVSHQETQATLSSTNKCTWLYRFKCSFKKLIIYT